MKTITGMLFLVGLISYHAHAQSDIEEYDITCEPTYYYTDSNGQLQPIDGEALNVNFGENIRFGNPENIASKLVTDQKNFAETAYMRSPFLYWVSVERDGDLAEITLIYELTWNEQYNQGTFSGTLTRETPFAIDTTLHENQRGRLGETKDGFMIGKLRISCEWNEEPAVN